jgi:hypothetical protein
LRNRTAGPPPFSSMNSTPTGFHQVSGPYEADWIRIKIET